ncbi:MAG: PaaI family thioesterase [Parasphingorhabdus sp.]|uniref:PaaI family thioesterase n=1 Tax=Parasphingorhabdus sp. TaxID=2709688 RepID=UPI0032990708
MTADTSFWGTELVESLKQEDILGFKRPPCSEAVNAVILEADKETGTVRMRFDAPQAFTSPRGTIQGGFVAAMVDEVIGIPVLVQSGGENAPLTLDLSVTYIEPVLPGRVYGEAQLVRLGRTIAFLEAQLYDETGALLVKATSTAKVGPTVK